MDGALFAREGGRGRGGGSDVFVGKQTDELSVRAYRGFPMNWTLRLPKAHPLPDCVTGPAEMPKLDPRPMPALPMAWPAPQDAAAQRHRMPLWRKFEQIEND